MKVTQEWLDKRITELVKEANFYITKGRFSKKNALKITREGTMLSDKQFQQVINLVDV